MSYIGAVVTLSCWCIPEAIDVALREEEIESSAAEFRKLSAPRYTCIYFYSSQEG